MSDNLKIIYKNLADSATLTASSTAGTSTTVANLKINSRSKVWRSGATTNAIFLVSMSSAAVSGIILPFTNFTTSATIRVKGYTSTLPTIAGTLGTPTLSGGSAPVYDSGTVNACPWTSGDAFSLATVPSGVSRYSYGGGTCARLWLSSVNSAIAVTGLSIEISDSGNPDSYLEISRLVIGSSWSPKYNTSYGVTAGFSDLSSNDRLQSGDLITNRGIQYKSLSFDLKYMDGTDRDKMISIFKGPGISLPIFISVFPNDTDAGREGLYQIYGKLSQLDSIAYSFLDVYSSKISIEET